jgi:hypothetical protein
MDTSFAAGDWVFTRPQVVVGTSNVTQNVYGLCVGDVNGSYTPTTGTVFAKQTNAQGCGMNNVGEERVETNGEFEVVIRAGVEMDLGAASLELSYPRELGEYLGLKPTLEGTLSNGGEGRVSISWYSGDGKGKRVEVGRALAVVRFRAVGREGAFGIGVGLESELTDIEGGRITGAVVTVPTVMIGGLPRLFSLGQNYPNPFNPTTRISYSLPKSAYVRLTVFNMLGQAVAELVEGEQGGGEHAVTWEARNMPSGTYIYRICVTTESGSMVANKTLTLIK